MLSHCDLRMSEKGAKLDTPVERTGCERELVVPHPKVVADHSRHEREGLGKKLEPEPHPAEAREQRSRQREAEEESLHAAFGSHLHAKGSCRLDGRAIMRGQMTAPEPTRPRLSPVIRVMLHAMRMLGAFKLAQFLTRKRLRILAYHGIAVGDQHEFAPFLFMQESTFRRRLEILRKRRMQVISLDDAVKRLQAGSNRAAEVVITIDDGWWSTLEFAAPLLKRFGYPATLYLSTRHAVEGTPVAPVVLGYMFWKRNETRLGSGGR